MDWRRRAKCRQGDPDAFFPEKGEKVDAAKAICNGRRRGDVPCPVRAECLEMALENDERFGVWGGLSERERRKLPRSKAS